MIPKQLIEYAKLKHPAWINHNNKQGSVRLFHDRIDMTKDITQALIQFMLKSIFLCKNRFFYSWHPCHF